MGPKCPDKGRMAIVGRFRRGPMGLTAARNHPSYIVQNAASGMIRPIIQDTSIPINPPRPVEKTTESNANTTNVIDEQAACTTNREMSTRTPDRTKQTLLEIEKLYHDLEETVKRVGEMHEAINEKYKSLGISRHIPTLKNALSIAQSDTDLRHSEEKDEASMVTSSRSSPEASTRNVPATSSRRPNLPKINTGAIVSIKASDCGDIKQGARTRFQVHRSGNRQAARAPVESGSFIKKNTAIIQNIVRQRSGRNANGSDSQQETSSETLRKDDKRTNVTGQTGKQQERNKPAGQHKDSSAPVEVRKNNEKIANVQRTTETRTGTDKQTTGACTRNVEHATATSKITDRHGNGMRTKAEEHATCPGTKPNKQSASTNRTTDENKDTSTKSCQQDTRRRPVKNAADTRSRTHINGDATATRTRSGTRTGEHVKDTHTKSVQQGADTHTKTTGSTTDTRARSDNQATDSRTRINGRTTDDTIGKCNVSARTALDRNKSNVKSNTNTMPDSVATVRPVRRMVVNKVKPRWISN